MEGLAQKRRRAGGWELWDELGGVFHERGVRRDSFSLPVYSNCALEKGYFVQRKHCQLLASGFGVREWFMRSHLSAEDPLIATIRPRGTASQGS